MTELFPKLKEKLVFWANFGIFSQKTIRTLDGGRYCLGSLLPTKKNWVAFKEKPNLSPRAPKIKGCSTSFFRGLPGVAFEFWPNFLYHLPRGDTMPPKKAGVRLESLSSFGGIFFFQNSKKNQFFQLIFWKNS